jgi:phospholipid-transporting ATPase
VDFASVQHLRGKIEMEHPNKMIDSFTGVIDLEGIGREPIQPHNVILRGCILRNTDWVIGCVLNTGHDTKILMSAAKTPNKASQLDVMASLEVKHMVGLLATVCLTGALGSLIWNSVYDVKGAWYLAWENANLGAYFVVQFFYFFLLHATFIPVSLYVSMTLVRFFQASFMNNDLEMYYEPTDTPALVRTMTLNEELGQISHVFSDKTGTLTCNVMDFRKASINGISYGLGITEIGKASWKLQGKAIPDDILDGEEKAKACSVPHVSFYDPLFEEHRQRSDLQSQRIQEFFRILALCHDTIPERIDGKIKLSASNPDDECLVVAAKYFGAEFLDRRESFAIFQSQGRTQEVEVLEILGFTSKRKRMSVVIRDVDGVIRVLTKGADSVMAPRLAAGQANLFSTTDAHMQQYAQEGLRCLLVGFKEIAQAEFEKWSVKYNNASTDLAELEKKKSGLPNLIEDLEEEFEQQFILVGSTAIEDKLQDGVPEAIEQIARAGVNIWVLTGDKEETAINIAVACNLVKPKEYMKHVIINQKSYPTLQACSAVLQNECRVRFPLPLDLPPSDSAPRSTPTKKPLCRPPMFCRELSSSMDRPSS